MSVVDWKLNLEIRTNVLKFTLLANTLLLFDVFRWAGWDFDLNSLVLGTPLTIKFLLAIFNAIITLWVWKRWVK